MNPKALTVLEDIRMACDRILAKTSGVSLSAYSASHDLRDIVERNFIKIGDALNRLIDAEPSYTSRISHAARIIGFRNQLTHGYHLIENSSVHDTAVRDVPLLRREVTILIEEQLSRSEPANR
jgi:uncharacterized protein with HEPN domain